MLQFGYEQRGCASAGLLALDSLASVFYATNLARDAHKFTDIVTIYTNANTTLANDIAEALTTVSMRVDDRKIKRLIKGPGKSEVILEFEGGGPKTEGFLVHRPLAKLDRTLADQLGLEFGPIGEIKVNPPFHQTSVPGVYAAGDCASMFKIIPNAISMGSYAGAGVARELPRREIGSSEDWNPLDQGRAELEALLA